jgi:hypothetical protein
MEARTLPGVAPSDEEQASVASSVVTSTAVSVLVVSVVVSVAVSGRSGAGTRHPKNAVNSATKPAKNQISWRAERPTALRALPSSAVSVPVAFDVSPVQLPVKPCMAGYASGARTEPRPKDPITKCRAPPEDEPLFHTMAVRSATPVSGNVAPKTVPSTQAMVRSVT